VSEEEQNKLFKKAFANTLRKLAEEPEELFDNDKLRKKYNNLLKEQIKLKQEIERLNNIINELEIHLKILLESCYQLEDEYDLNMKIETIEEISQKLQELKGSDKE
jgi:uncharacterized protein YlxW (UPF0749 family)